MSYTQDQCQGANLSHKPQYIIEYMLVLLKHLLGLLVSPSMKFHNIDTELKKNLPMHHQTHTIPQLYEHMSHNDLIVG